MTLVIKLKDLHVGLPRVAHLPMFSSKAFRAARFSYEKNLCEMRSLLKGAFIKREEESLLMVLVSR